MSNVTSLELSKELYTISGWKTDTMGLHQDTPLYELGYLWRKFEQLGNEQSVGYDDSGCFYHFHYGVRGTGRQIGGVGTQWYSGEPQDSIEDAFCEFFIELFKQNILTREKE